MKLTPEQLQILIQIAEDNTMIARSLLLEKDGTCSDQFTLDLEFIYELPDYEED